MNDLHKHSVISRLLFDEAEKHKLQVNEIAITIEACHEEDKHVDIVVSDLFWNELSRYKSLTGL